MSPSEQPIPFPGAPVQRPVAGDWGTGTSQGETDARLLAEIASGHVEALSELYRNRGGALLGLLRRILADPQEAEEALQDAFLQFWRRAGTYDAAKASPLTWMILITRGLALDRLRRRSRRSAGLERFQELAERTEFQSGIDHGVQDSVDSAQPLHQALGKLPLEQRQAIELAFFRGCSQSEIAEVTGEPLGTIKARIRRGMLTLRKKLKGHHA